MADRKRAEPAILDPGPVEPASPIERRPRLEGAVPTPGMFDHRDARDLAVQEAETIASGLAAPADPPAPPTPPPAPVSWAAPEVPTLDPGAVSAIIRDGGLAGLVGALRDRMPGLACPGDVAAAASSAAMTLDAYQAPDGLMDHAECLAGMDAAIRSAGVLHEALRLAARWIADHPGVIVPGGPFGRHRVFPAAT